MTTVTTSGMTWLDQDEAEYAAEQATIEADSARIAASMAESVNERLAELGITPFRRATVDGDNVVPAMVAPEDPGGEFYGVYATLDEEDGYVLLASDCRGENGFQLRRASVDLDGPRSVVLARRYGPAPTPKPQPKPRMSTDAQAIVQALGSLANAVENAGLSVARAAGRP